MIALDEAVARADSLVQQHRSLEARDVYLDAVRATSRPDGTLLLKLTRCLVDLGEIGAAYVWLKRLCDTTFEFLSWMSASTLLAEMSAQEPPPVTRSARIAICGTFTTSQLAHVLPLAAFRAGIHLDVYETPYDQYQQEILDPRSGLSEFRPDYVVLVPHEAALQLPKFSDSPDEAVQIEVERWTALWAIVHERLGAGVVHVSPPLRPETALGHLGPSIAGARETMARQVGMALVAAASGGDSIIDGDRIAATFGKDRWFDDRYWFRAKQAVALDALPLLAQHIAAVLAGRLGANRKCLVLDLDNTLWGGVIGEDGVGGIRLGDGPVGEAYVALQEFVVELKDKGVILAVVTKNNLEDAREPFGQHPDMRLTLDDFAVFIANWTDKPTNIREVARRLNIGLDALVLLDDNPAEREIVRQAAPEVDVIDLPDDPARYRRALAEYPWFETVSLTTEDRDRTAQYRARAEISALQDSTTNIEEFWRSLDMVADVSPFDDVNLGRVAQLVGKTNQFNLTGRRRDLVELAAVKDDPSVVHLALRLRDRFVDHGLVAVLIARRDGAAADTFEIDTFLMSCRVVARTVENAMLSQLCLRVTQAGCSRIVGTYVPSAKNALVGDLYPHLGFAPAGERDGVARWEYDIARSGSIPSDFIRVTEEHRDGR